MNFFALTIGAILLAVLPAVQAQCRRYPEGSLLPDPAMYYGGDGQFSITLYYRGQDNVPELSGQGFRRYCYIERNTGAQCPTMRMRPGDDVTVTIINQLNRSYEKEIPDIPVPGACGAKVLNGASNNMHFHGFRVPAQCHQDQITTTLINAGDTFTYKFHIPATEPSGLYFYHTHVYLLTYGGFVGGATGSIIFEGIEDVFPQLLDGVVERVIEFRDYPDPTRPEDSPPATWPTDHILVNYVPVRYPQYVLPRILMEPGVPQFWRLLSSGSGVSLRLSLTIDNTSQPLLVLAIDGTPLVSPRIETVLHMPSGSRYEVLATLPIGLDASRVKLITQYDPFSTDIGSGPHVMPARPLLQVQAATAAEIVDQNYNVLRASANLKNTVQSTRDDIKAALAATPAAQRQLYFSQHVRPDRTDGSFGLYVTVVGQQEEIYNVSFSAPKFEVTAGTVEDWVIINKASEEHEFHIHQIDFLILAYDGVPVATPFLQFQDTIRVPPLTRVNSDPNEDIYHNVTLRVVFKGDISGTPVYHCHIIDHEDLGMMAQFRILPADDGSSSFPGWGIAIIVVLGSLFILLVLFGVYKYRGRTSGHTLRNGHQNGNGHVSKVTESSTDSV
eukprot:m.40596 g.40596  ORF g.40596 m.40596 type:complete len:614 (-) comp5622_c0_seq2:61-1902(-)